MSSLLEAPLDWQNFFEFWKKKQDYYQPLLPSYQVVEPRIIFLTRKILPAIHKDVLPSFHQSMVLHQYVCRCDCWYVGQTSQR